MTTPARGNTPPSDLLQAGIAAVKAGNLAKANAYLAQVVRDDPCSEQGWLWLGRCRATAEERAYCFNQVLAINPVNLEARDELRGGVPDSVLQAARTAGSSGTLPVELPCAPAAPGEKHAPRLNRKQQMILAGLAGFMVLALIGGGIWVISSLPASVPAVTLMPMLPPPPTPVPPTPTPSPTATNVVYPTEWTKAPAVVVTTTPSPTPTTSAQMLATAQALSTQAAQAIQAGDAQKALQLLNQAVSAAPGLGVAYYLRAAAGSLLAQPGDAAALPQPQIYPYLRDINTALALDGPSGDYDLVRYRLEQALAIAAAYRVDQDLWNALSLPDIQQAVQLGNSSQDTEQNIPFVLANAGQCQEAVDYANELLQAKPQTTSAIYSGLAAGDLCRNDLANALKHIETAIKGQATPGRLFARTVILYGLGRYADARAQFDEVFKAKPNNVCPCRYIWRALLDAKLNDWAAIPGDVATAGQPMPSTGGVDAYVQGLLAQKQGDKAGALRYFQTAEARLTRADGPVLLAEIQQQLDQAGGAPLAPTLSAPATPAPKP